MCCDNCAIVVFLTHTYIETDGRLEDGYLAWSSVYLHEYFGFTIYHPLTPTEQFELKQRVHAVPPWIHEFTALPNLAILLSYFCIGVALQLLRTPLIVYFIADQDATPAQVNVLFTVSKWHHARVRGFVIEEVARKYLLTHSYIAPPHLFIHHSGSSMVFQSHLRIPFRLRADSWSETQALLYDWLARLHWLQFIPDHYAISQYPNVYSPSLYTNSRIHVG